MNKNVSFAELWKLMWKGSDKTGFMFITILLPGWLLWISDLIQYK